MFFYLDIYYLIIVVPFVLLALLASLKVNATFKRYSAMETMRGISGAEAARLVLKENGVVGVGIARCSGKLTDHFDPRDNTIYLSDDVYDGRNAAACGVAAHEAGHAVQYATGYAPMKLRAAIIPATNIGSNLAFPLILLGLIFLYQPLAWAGVIAFSLSTLFQLVTLPVEFNASRRAMAALSQSGSFNGAEQDASRRVLSAAAMTYLAALAVSLANLLRLVLIVGGSGRRRS